MLVLLCASVLSGVIVLPSPVGTQHGALAAPPLACPDLPLPYALDPAPVDMGDGGRVLHCEYTIMDSASEPTAYTVAIVSRWYEVAGAGAAAMCELNREANEHLETGGNDSTPAAIENLRNAATVAWSVNGPAPGGGRMQDDAVAAPAYVPPAAGELDWALDAVAVACDDPVSLLAGGAPSTTATTPDPERKPLCSEAVALLEGFGSDRLLAAGITDTSRTGMRVDGDELLADFRAAISSYDAANPDGGAYVSDGTPFAGEIGALNWLFGYGGAVGGPPARAYVTGHELDLQKRLISRAEGQASGGQPDRLTPGEVLEEALALTRGDVNQAMLAAHNLLRGSARNDSDSAPGVLMDSGAFIDTYLVKLRDGENGGPWYHLFGTAYMEVVAQGDWGPWIAAGGAAAAFSAGLLTGPAALALGGLALAWQNESDTSGTTNASRFSNGLEQIVRETGWRERAGNRPDPEKYCFNVWGAQAGARLYEELPYKSTRSMRRLVSGFSSPGVSPEIDPVAHLRGTRFVSSVQSPFSVEWDDGRVRMVLDQGGDPANAEMLGGIPGWVLPVYEGESWGVAWIEETSAQPTIVLEATRDGAPLHFARTDVLTGETAVYEAAAASAGDRYEVTLSQDSVAPVMTGPGGGEVVPSVVTLDVEVPDPWSPPVGDAEGVETAGAVSAAEDVAGAGETGAASVADTVEAGAVEAGGAGSGLPPLTIVVALAVLAVAVTLEARRRA